MDTVRSATTEPVRRLEVFTGAGRRRKWSDEDKARIVAETVASGDLVCAVARRHGLSPQQLFGWRRQLREAAARHSEAEELQFVPAVVDAGASAPVLRRRRKAPRSKSEPDVGMIEVEIDGVTIRIGRGADADDDRGIVAGAEGRRVIGPTGAVRVMVATKPVDFRKGAEGLAALVRESMRPIRSRARSTCSVPSARTGSSWCSGMARVCACSPSGWRTASSAGRRSRTA